MNKTVNIDIASLVIGFMPYLVYVIIKDLGLGIEPFAFIIATLIAIIGSKGKYRLDLLKWEFIAYLLIVFGVQTFEYAPYDKTFLKGVLYLVSAIFVANYIILSFEIRMHSFLKGLIASIVLSEIYILIFAQARDSQFEGIRRTLEFFSSSQIALIASISIIWSFAKLSVSKGLNYYLVMLLGVVSVIAAFSKSGMVAPFVAIGFYILFYGKKNIIRYAFGAAIIVFIIFYFFQSSVTGFTDFIEKQNERPEWDFNGRTSIWEIAILNFLNNPWFGNGYFHSQELLEQFTSLEATQAHSLYYQLLMSVGIVGTAAMLFYYIRILYYQTKLLKYNNQSWIVIWFNCMCIYFLIRGVTEASIAQCPSIDAFFFVIISMSTIHLYKINKNVTEKKKI